MPGYKLIKNRIMIRLLKFFYIRISNGFWSNSKNGNKDNFLIDLSNQDHEHFGDQLFFIFAIIQLPNKDKFLFKVNEEWVELYKFFNLRFTTEELIDFNSKEYVLVTTFRSFVDIKNKKYFKKVVLFDSMDKNIDKPLCEQIFYFFLQRKFKF